MSPAALPGFAGIDEVDGVDQSRVSIGDNESEGGTEKSPAMEMV